ncbi:hypothetical protein C8Q73DRAFT_635205 [Cubamyces lactineus]|nr:hypothetical protein C8Q73DRAFT_635205 [Cubamyces lactineus]
MEHSTPDCTSPATCAFGNWDIFRLILTYLPTRDVLQMSYIAREFREDALRERLARHIHIKAYSQVSSLYRFISSSNSAGRLACVRALTFAFPLTLKLPPNVHKDELAGLLEGCKNLRYLEILHCDQLISENPRLSTIIPSLAKLHTFDASRTVILLTDPSIAFTRMITSLRSTLDKLRLPCIPLKDKGARFLQDLAATQTHLRRLSFAAYQFLPASVSFPSVVSLTITLGYECPRLRDLYRTFPNAREISVNWRSDFDVTKPPEDAIAARHLAEEDCGRGDAWRSLDMLSAPSAYLYVFALNCPTRRLVLRDLDIWRRPNYAADLVSRLRPRQLDVIVECKPPFAVRHVDPRLFIYDGGSSALAHLYAKMLFFPIATVPNTRDVINIFRSILSVSRVELFHLDLHDAVPIGDPYNAPLPTSFQLELAKHTAAIDLTAVVRELAECCTSLRIVIMNIDARPDSRYWIVTRDQGRPHIEELDPYYGRRLVAREEEHLQ